MTQSITKASKAVAQAADKIFSEDQAEKVGVFIKLDRSVVEWFKSSGPGYQARINEVLRRFLDAVEGDNMDSASHATCLKKAQELYEKYYEQCFWYMKRNLIITKKDLPQIIKGLKTYGGRNGYLEACKLCR